MSATDELRRLLDERGVEWWEDAFACEHRTVFDGKNDVRYCVYQLGSSLFISSILPVTPEPAIEAWNARSVSGDTSDGYHTFDELYHHRAVLFSVIVRDRPALAWKAKKHHDGTMYDGMFIVGIETPNGQATYHYDIDPYWDMFECRELDAAPEWDGHTPDDAIARIATLGRGTCSVVEIDADPDGIFKRMIADENGVSPDKVRITRPVCSECGETLTHGEGIANYCPNCGARVVER